MDEKTVIIFSYDLTNASKNFIKRNKLIKEALLNQGISFLSSDDTSKCGYYNKIHDKLRSCNLLICDCTYLTSAIFLTLMIAVEGLRIPTIVITRATSHVDNLIREAECPRNPSFHFKRYRYKEIPALIDYIVEMIDRLEGD